MMHKTPKHKQQQHMEHKFISQNLQINEKSHFFGFSNAFLENHEY